MKGIAVFLSALLAAGPALSEMPTLKVRDLDHLRSLRVDKLEFPLLLMPLETGMKLGDKAVHLLECVQEAGELTKQLMDEQSELEKEDARTIQMLLDEHSAERKEIIEEAGDTIAEMAAELERLQKIVDRASGLETWEWIVIIVGVVVSVAGSGVWYGSTR